MLTHSPKIRVMIVEDSILQRAMIRSILERDKENRFQIVASANNGVDALEKLKRHYYEIDVITLDIEMPQMNGLEALKKIMQEYPRPTIMFSSFTKNGTKETIQALALGAVDFITKPDSGQVKDVEKELIEKVYLASKVKSSIYSKFKIDKPVKEEMKSPLIFPMTPKIEKVKKTGKLSNLILIGSSTGGPRTLTNFMSKLPTNLNACIVIVQHMQLGFTASFANSLNQVSCFDVKEASSREKLQDGCAFVAPAGLQAEVFLRNGQYELVLNDKHSEFRHKPSVDVLFSSVARINPKMHTFGVVLTGMGHDGSDGAQALKRINSTIIAESERTAILYGMPKQVAKRGLADYIEDVDDIIPRIMKIIKAT